MPLVDVAAGALVFLRQLPWCRRHDVAWASCHDLGLRVPGCTQGWRWVEDPTKEASARAQVEAGDTQKEDG